MGALAILACVSSAIAAAEQAPPLVTPARADAAALEEALAPVERERPKPDWAEYVPVLAAAFLSRLWDGIQPLRSLLSFGAATVTALAWAFVVIVALALLAALCGFAPWRRKARASVTAAGPGAGSAPAAPAGPREWSLELERRLAAGDLAGALEALWWIFAGAIGHGEVRASWTSGELVARAGREDLRPLALQLDRFRYGPRPPGVAEVRALAGRLSARVGGGEARA